MSYQFESISDVPEGLGEGLTNFLLEVKSVIDLALSRTDINYIPELDYEFANKKYVDDTIDASGNVTGGNSHDHAGGDGAPISHGNLLNKGSYSHSQIDTHINSPNPHSGSMGSTFLDNEYISFGNGPDARIGFNGNDFVIQSNAGAETFAAFHSATLGVSLYYNDVVVLETTASGINISDGLAAHEISIFFSGEHAYFQNDDASGNIYIRGRDSADTTYHLILFGNPDAGTNLYYDGAAVLKTNAAGITVTDDVAVGTSLFYTSDDFYIYNTDPGGKIYLRGETIDSGGGARTLLFGDPDGSLELYHDGGKVLETVSKGIAIIDPADVSRRGELYFSGDSLFLQNKKASANLYLTGRNAGNTADHILAYGDPDGKFFLYYNNGLRLETNNSGIAIMDGVAAGIEIIYSGENAHFINTDPGGQVNFIGRNVGDTADNFIFVGDPDGQTQLFYDGILALGTNAQGMTVWDTSGADPTIYLRDDANNLIGQINMFNNDLYLSAGRNISGGGQVYLRAWNGTAYDILLQGTQGGDVELYNDSNKVFFTQDDGIAVMNSANDSPTIEFWNNAESVVRGTVGYSSNDLGMFNDVTGGDVYVRATDGEVYIRTDTLQNAIICNYNGSVDLYHNGSKIVYTTSVGIRTAVSPFFVSDSANNKAIKITAAGATELSYNGNAKAETFNEGLTVRQVLKLLERTSDPTKPSEGEAVMWMSDGTGLGADGDIIIGVTAGGNTRYSIIYVHATATTWV